MSSPKAKAGRFLTRNTIGLLALFVALGGTSYAAVSLPKNSVGSSQIKARAVSNSELRGNAISSGKLRAGSVTTSKLKDGAVTSEKITDGSIESKDLKSTATATPTDGSVIASKLGKLPAVRVQPANSFTQAIPDGLTTNTLLVLGTTTQVNNLFTLGDSVLAGPPPATPATTLKIPVTGVYNVSGGVRWSAAVAPNDGGVRTLTLGTNTGAIPAGSTIPGAAATLRQNIATSLYLTAGSELYLFVSQNSGAALNVSQSQGATFFAATLATP